MTTVLKVNISDISPQFFQDLKDKFGKSALVEIRVEEQKHGEGLLSDEQFWAIIEMFDWSKKNRTDIIAPAVVALSKMPMSSIYLFQDKLSEKLYQLDTRAHADGYLSKQDDDYLSVDDFLYVRCAVVAEGKAYYEQILNNPSEIPVDIDFEHLLSLADEAYKLKTGKEFNYFPIFNYETHSNAEGWKA
ncbi:MAG: DUF4240 domain-containing protein [Saprospiraceae bacterium]|nr:DUF4240 domain-containing protein [Saprospiraceae bacterium]